MPAGETPAQSFDDALGWCSQRPARILLAEDNPLNQEIAKSIHETSGDEVDVASNGEQAMEAVRKKRYDVVLMRIEMPIMDGMTATQQIRALAGDERVVPIIALTANVMANDVAQFRSSGLDGHLGKPFKVTTLFEVIDRCLSRRADALSDFITVTDRLKADAAPMPKTRVMPFRL